MVTLSTATSSRRACCNPFRQSFFDENLQASNLTGIESAESKHTGAIGVAAAFGMKGQTHFLVAVVLGDTGNLTVAKQLEEGVDLADSFPVGSESLMGVLISKISMAPGG
jgi:hypothetical protein